MAKPDLAPGDAFVPGRSRIKAQELIAAAEEAGIDSALIRTTLGGYIVPEELLSPPKTPRGRGRRRAKPSEPPAPAIEAAPEPEVGSDDTGGDD